MKTFKPARSYEWTAERVGKLATEDIRQLRANATRLGEDAITELCDQALKARPRANAKTRAATGRTRPQRLISRSKAFQARGVYVAGAASWSGVRKSDGQIVFAIWAGAVQNDAHGCSSLLWSPNVEGARPWSDLPPGKERLEHCKLALERGAEGLLVYGEALEGYLPEQKSRTIHGVDPEVVIQFRVEQRGADFWALWGGNAAKSL